MRIVLLTSSMGPGGAERVAATLCNKWTERGDKVSLIATFSRGGTGTFYTLSAGVEFLYLADVAGVNESGLFRDMHRIRALRRLIVERRPDVVVSFLPNVNVAALLSTAFLPVPVIICERSDPSSRSYPWMLKRLCRLSYRFADVLAVQTEVVAAKMNDMFPGLRRVRAIPNPLPAGVAAMRAGKKRERKILLSLGRLGREKQVDQLVTAFAQLAPTFSDWDLHIYGDGPLRRALENQIVQLALDGRVFLKGPTTSPWEVMIDADAFALVSAYEGFPNALLEAMGVGLPCISVDCPSGPREITRDGKDALLVPPFDHDELVAALARMMGDEALRTALGARARESVTQRFGVDKVIQSWDLLFREVGASR